VDFTSVGERKAGETDCHCEEVVEDFGKRITLYGVGDSFVCWKGTAMQVDGDARPPDIGAKAVAEVKAWAILDDGKVAAKKCSRGFSGVGPTQRQPVGAAGLWRCRSSSVSVMYRSAGPFGPPVGSQATSQRPRTLQELSQREDGECGKLPPQ
jgi:hypothetical protein